MTGNDNLNLFDWVTSKQVVELTGYTTMRFRQLNKANTIGAQKLGRDWFLSKDSVLDWAAETKKLGTAKHDPRGMATYD